jgi:hypothetical protein
MDDRAEKYLSLRVAFSREHGVAESKPANRKMFFKTLDCFATLAKTNFMIAIAIAIHANN